MIRFPGKMNGKENRYVVSKKFDNYKSELSAPIHIPLPKEAHVWQYFALKKNRNLTNFFTQTFNFFRNDESQKEGS